MVMGKAETVDEMEMEQMKMKMEMEMEVKTMANEEMEMEWGMTQIAKVALTSMHGF